MKITFGERKQAVDMCVYSTIILLLRIGFHFLYGGVCVHSDDDTPHIVYAMTTKTSHSVYIMNNNIVSVCFSISLSR